MKPDQSDADTIGAQLVELKADNAKLKAEVERLTKKLAIADAEVFILRSDLKSKGAQGSPQK